MAVAFLQRPGREFTDTRIELSIDPGAFLSRVADVWSSTGDLGHVQGGLFAGYLFPAGPYYALADAVGLPTWVAQRLWLGLILALAAWGVVRLMDELWGRSGPLGGRGLVHVAAGLLYALNGYVVVSLALRGSGPLLAYAALPWLLVFVHRALAEPGRWRWPAAAGLVVAAAGGAVNAAYVAWMLLGGLALGLYEAGVLGRGRRALGRAGWRTAACIALASAWWLVPLLVQGRYGADFQQFAEQPSTIWATTSVSESLRLMGFWVLYLAAGFGEAKLQLSVAADYLFSAPVVVATLLVPLLAFGALRLTRRWAYAPFFGLLAAGAVVAMAAGYPPGTPLQRALLVTSGHWGPFEVLRTTYKAAPLLALSTACLAAVAANVVTERAAAGRLRLGPFTAPAWSVPAALLVVAALASLPLVEGRGLDRDATYGHLPPAWSRAMEAASRATPPDHRMIVLPGALFARYRWGFTGESVAPILARRPALVRQTIRYADQRASQLLDVTDDLIQQDRLLPGQLAPLLRLMGVGQVVVATDGDPRQSGELPPAGVHAALAGQPDALRPLQAFGGRRRFEPLQGRSGAAVTLPELARYEGPRPLAPGIVRLESDRGATVVDGDAEGLAELAGQGALDTASPLFYAGDLDRGELGRLVRRGAALVFTDSARRRAVVAARMRENHGPTLGPDDPLGRETASFDLFPGAGQAARTVALYTGARHLRAGGVAEPPEHRPFAAFDGRLGTVWLSSGPTDTLEIELRRPRRVRAIRLHPHADARGRTTRIGVAVNGGDERTYRMRPGWNRIPVGDAPLRTLGLRVDKVEGGEEKTRGSGGVDEVAVPGLHVRERLRAPTRLAREARGLDLSRTPVTILLERTTADFPYRAGAAVGTPQAQREIDMVDAEPGLVRELSLPARRTFRLDGWASAAPAGGDSAIDRLAGVAEGWRMDSSGPFEGVPGRRASSAFDGDRRTAWVGEVVPGGRPWLSLTAPRPLRLSRLRLVATRGYLAASRVRVSVGRSAPEAAVVQPNGRVSLRRPLAGRSLRLEVLATRPPPSGLRRRKLRAVGISELELPGASPPRPRRRGRFASACGELAVRSPAGRATARVSGRIEDLDGGRPLRLAGCGPGARLTLPAGATRMVAPPGTAFRPDHVRLRSAAPKGPVAGGGPAGGVLDPGHGLGSHRDGVRLALRTPAWLVLGESYSPAWRASCRDRSGRDHDLGAPEPIDGFANGWRVGPWCAAARFSFGPQRAALAGYLVSALAALVMLALLALSALRSRARGRPEAFPVGPGPAPPDPARRLGWRRALLAGVAVGLAAGFVFALRAGVVLGPATVLALRLGIRARTLLGVAAVLVAAIPVAYLVFPGEQGAREAFRFPEHHLGAHWLAVGALVCLAAGCALDAHARRGPGPPLSSRRDG